MTADSRIERTLPAVLADLGAHDAPDYVDDILAGVAVTRQRPTWAFPSRWLPADVSLGPNRYLLQRAQWLALIVVIALVAAAAIVVVGSRPKVPPPFGPAANGLVAYGSNGDIFVGNPVDQTSRLIVGGPDTYDYLPFYAPDGVHVAFFRAVDGRLNSATQLVVVRDDGSAMVFPKTPPLLELPGRPCGRRTAGRSPWSRKPRRMATC